MVIIMQDIKRVNIILLIIILLEELVTSTGVMRLVHGIPLQMLASQLILCGPMLLFPFVFKKNFFKCVGLNKIRFSDIMLSVLFYFCINKVLSFINGISMLISPNKIGSLITNMSDSTPYLLAVLVVGIIPAFCEECMNRGIIYNTYKQADPLRAMLMSALVFGLMHGNLNQFSYAFFMGFIFILLNEATGSLASSMTVHMLANVVSTTLVYLLPKLTSTIKELVGAVTDGKSSVSGLEQTTESLSQLFKNVDKKSILSSLPSITIEAALGGLGAFFIFRWIAKRNGRWDYIKGIFSKKHRNMMSEEKKENVPGPVIECEAMHIITTPLIIVLAILAFNIIVDGLVDFGVISRK